MISRERKCTNVCVSNIYVITQRLSSRAVYLPLVPSSFGLLWVQPGPTTMIGIVYLLQIAENIDHVKNHIDRTPFDMISKCINLVFYNKKNHIDVIS